MGASTARYVARAWPLLDTCCSPTTHLHLKSSHLAHCRHNAYFTWVPCHNFACPNDIPIIPPLGCGRRIRGGGGSPRHWRYCERALLRASCTGAYVHTSAICIFSSRELRRSTFGLVPAHVSVAAGEVLLVREWPIERLTELSILRLIPHDTCTGTLVIASSNDSGTTL